MSRKITDEEYKAYFNDECLDKALEQAYQIRKFEIELYWKRATYFWTFIGAAFVSYGAFYNANHDKDLERELILVLIACIGLVFSVAWHCVNKGSKFWQENWENHVELLEDKVFGPLYKTFTKRPDSKFDFSEDAIADLFVAPEPFSVSKINQLVSTFIAVIWLLILHESVSPICLCGCKFVWKEVVLVALSLITCVGFWSIGKSYQGKHNPQTFLRETGVSWDDA